jgi:uncharacterized protein (DUF58 family)
MIVLLSDLLTPVEDLKPRLGFLRSQGHEVVLLRVLDPAEIDFTFSKSSTFIDMETGKDLYIDPVLARERYQAKFNAHAAEVGRACRDLGIDLFQIATSRPLELVLFDFLQARTHLGRVSHRPGHRAASTGAAGEGGRG